MLKTKAPIEILKMHEIPFIHQADLIKGTSPDQHKRPGDGLDRDGTLGDGKTHMKISRGLALSDPSTLKGEDLHKSAPGRWDISPATRLLAAIGVSDHAADHTDRRVLVKKPQHLL